jgi:hypothetical protein
MVESKEGVTQQKPQCTQGFNIGLGSVDSILLPKTNVFSARYRPVMTPNQHVRALTSQFLFEPAKPEYARVKPF